MNSTRWFDENGEEIHYRNKKSNSQEAEKIGEIGGKIEEFNVTLNLFGKELNRQEITELLQCEPTAAWNPNELHSIGNKGKKRITDWGKWYLSIGREKGDLNVKIKDLLGQVTQSLEVWQILGIKYDVWLVVSGRMSSWNKDFVLNVETMKLVSERNLDILFDIYYYDDKNEIL